MLNKQTLKLENKFSENLVSIKESRTAYIDDAYYSQVIREDKAKAKYKNYPVQVFALKIGWILQNEEEDEEQGTNFLREISNSEN